MSSSTAAQPNGQKRDPPPPGAPPLRRLVRPKPKSNPLVARKIGPAKQTAFRPPPKQESSRRPPDDSEKRWEELKAKRAANGGWSETPPQGYKEFPLCTTKRALREGLRYHIMRFNRSADEAPVDPTDQDQFPRPVSLHRRDPRSLPPGRVPVKGEDKDFDQMIDEAEAERQRIYKEQKEAQRAADLAQIAPVLKQAETKPIKLDKKQKALSTYYPKQTAEAKKASALRYEETLPWHLEDADGKSVWVGNYVAALSEVNVAFVINGGGFRMIPLERYYNFKQKPGFQLMSLEQAEKIMGKMGSDDIDRWVKHDKDRNEEKAMIAETRSWLGGGAKVKLESDTSRSIPKAERRDDNDIDMSGDEFQDDDETPGFEADDEETKDSKERLRKNHLEARIFDDLNEGKVEKEAEDEEREKMREKIQGKKLIKALVKVEKNMAYKTDSDSDNPFESSSDSDAEEEKKDKEGDDKKAEDGKLANQKEKLAPAINTKGNTTPSGKGKAPDVTKKVKSLKRPASPNASESSGNESSRKLKKIKKNLPVGSANVSRSATPMPSRPRGPGGATSDGEATAGEGSDAGLKPRAKKIKLKAGSLGTNSTPQGSRANSPAPLAPAGKTAGVATHDYAAKPSGAAGSSATSPAPGTAKPARVAGSSAPAPAPAPARGAAKPPAKNKPAQPIKTITGEEVIEAIRAAGGRVTLPELIKPFKGRVGDKPGQMARKDWVRLVRMNSEYNKEDATCSIKGATWPPPS